MKTVEFEVRISVYRNGRRITFNDAHAETAYGALYLAHNDLEDDCRDIDAKEA